MKDVWVPYPISFLDMIAAWKAARAAKKTAEEMIPLLDWPVYGPEPSTAAQEESDGEEMGPHQEVAAGVEVGGEEEAEVVAAGADEGIALPDGGEGLRASVAALAGMVEAEEQRLTLKREEQEELMLRQMQAEEEEEVQMQLQAAQEPQRIDSARPKVTFGGVTVGVDGAWVGGSQANRAAAAAHNWPRGIARCI
ncbi:hypothetical protein LTR08_001170 [Meristemomyces frigidus]|nr:hypothetical protein LTR08_001170 [Meristemomyces frigidus]